MTKWNEIREWVRFNQYLIENFASKGLKISLNFASKGL